tara:strand:+ start:2741 stop:3436 length:696 start_codon:yes stop_codon:yes gene_type:complete
MTSYYKCSCRWCTTTTSVQTNYTIQCPFFIRYGLGRDKTAIACIESFEDGKFKIKFCDGHTFNDLTNAGRFAHKNMLKKDTHDSNNGWKMWRINMNINGYTKPVTMHSLRENGIKFASSNFEDQNFGEFCHDYSEKCSQKTMKRFFTSENSIPKRQCIEEERIDLNTFSIDISDMPGDKIYNEIVFNGAFVEFSSISVSLEDERYYDCTTKQTNKKVKIPICVFNCLVQYK